MTSPDLSIPPEAPTPPPETTGRPPAAPALAVCVPAMLILALLPFVEMGKEAAIPKLFLFFGRFHPTLLHLPVAFLLLALFLVVVRQPPLRRAGLALPESALDLVVRLAALSAFVSALAGFVLAQEGGYDETLLRRHLWAGAATGILALGGALLRSLAHARPGDSRLPRAATGTLLAACGAMTVAAHLGGSLTHGEDYLTEHAPATLRRALGLHVPRDRAAEPLLPIGERQAFDGMALRVLERHCTECHNAGKLKGGLRLDTHEGVLEGGQSGRVVVAGDSRASELTRRLRLPVDDEKHMPPSGKEQPGPDAVAVLTWWIEAGLPDTETLRILRAPSELRAAFTRVLPEPEQRAVLALQQRMAAELEAALTQVRAAVPGSLRPVTPGERELEFTAAIAGGSFGDAELEKLQAVGSELVWLDLSRTAVSDGGLRVVAKMPNLERLDLRDTAVGDAGIQALTGLAKLQTLGLYGTRISDAGIASLSSLPALREVYVGGTRVSEAGREALRRARGELAVTP